LCNFRSSKKSLKERTYSNFFIIKREYNVMKKITLIQTMICTIACQPNKKTIDLDNQWSSLWNGQDMKGWNSYLGTPYNLEIDSIGNKIKPFGIDNDPLEVIKIVKTDEGNAIRISVVACGMIYTEQAFKTII